MLARELMGIVQAVTDSNTARNQATWAAALSNIGSTPTILVLTLTGDGIWTVTSNFTSQANVITFIPPGVTVNVPTGVTVTFNGPIISYNPNWQTGPGTVVRNTSTPLELSAIRSTQAQFQVLPDTIGVQVYSPSATPNPGIILQTSTSGGNIVPSITLTRNPADATQNWTISNNLTNMFHVSHPGGQAYFAVTNNGSWFGSGAATPTPTHLLQLSANDAFMPGGGPWGSSSDSRVKTVERLFADGLAILQALPEPIVFTYNGKGGMTADGHEYIGMMADDVQPVAPYMVSTYEALLEPDDLAPTELLGLNNGAMVYILINAVRELASRVEALEGALAATRQTPEAQTHEDEESPHPRQSRRRHS